MLLEIISSIIDIFDTQILFLAWRPHGRSPWESELRSNSCSLVLSSYSKISVNLYFSLYYDLIRPVQTEISYSHEKRRPKLISRYFRHRLISIEYLIIWTTIKYIWFPPNFLEYHINYWNIIKFGLNFDQKSYFAPKILFCHLIFSYYCWPKFWITFALSIVTSFLFLDSIHNSIISMSHYNQNMKRTATNFFIRKYIVFGENTVTIISTLFLE